MARFLFLLCFVASCTDARLVPEMEPVSLSMLSPPTLEVETVVGPYDGWEDWCEEPYKDVCHCAKDETNKIVCQPVDEDGNATTCPLSRTGRSQICLWPQWARKRGINRHECTQKWFTRKEQRKQREAQGVIVDHVCKPPAWWDDLSKWGGEHKYGTDAAKLCWRLKGGSKALKQCRSNHYCHPDKLHRFLRIPAKRETSWNHEKDHTLNPDKRANVQAYGKMKRRGVYDGNPHYYDADRWSRGYGWYGHNAALAVWYWDPHAPPEILCRRVESTEIHLRKMRRAFKKLWKMYRNDEHELKLDTGEIRTVRGVTWYDLHRATSSGQLTREDPVPTLKKKNRRPFAYRAKLVDLDPFETVMWEMLGDPIPLDEQNQIANQIRETLHSHFEAPKAGPRSLMAP